MDNEFDLAAQDAAAPVDLAGGKDGAVDGRRPPNAGRPGEAGEMRDTQRPAIPAAERTGQARPRSLQEAQRPRGHERTLR
jgi:hypothetical protein